MQRPGRASLDLRSGPQTIEFKIVYEWNIDMRNSEYRGAYPLEIREIAPTVASELLIRQRKEVCATHLATPRDR